MLFIFVYTSNIWQKYILIEYDIMMFLQGAHIPHAFGHEVCISLSSLQIEASEGQLEEISSHLQTLHVWGHNFLKAGISQLFAFATHEVFWSLQSKPTNEKSAITSENKTIKSKYLVCDGMLYFFYARLL